MVSRTPRPVSFSSSLRFSSDSAIRPVERVPRSQFGVVNPAPLSERDQPAFVYPSLDADERASMLEGLTFFTTPHTASEGLGPVANQTRCMGCHLSGDDNLSGFITTNSHVTRAARATPTNFRYTAFNPATGGGRAADNLVSKASRANKVREVVGSQFHSIDFQIGCAIDELK